MRFLSTVATTVTMATMFLTSAASNNAARAETFVYVSKPAEQHIAVFRFDPSDGSLHPTKTIDTEGAPGSMTTDPNKQFLFVSLRTNSSLGSYKFDGEGGLSYLGRTQLTEGANSAYQATDRTGKWLVSASYAGGKVVTYGLADGVIGELMQTVPTARTAHFVTFDKSNSWCFVPHVATNSIYQFSFDPVAGTLTDAGQAPALAENAGPRHLAWHPTLNMAFSSNETGSSITAYTFDPTTGLTPVQTLSTLPPDFAGSNTTAEVKVHPSGKFVWVSNRGHDSLASFTIDPAGKLAVLGWTPTEKTPRSFTIDPTGQWLFSAGEGSGNLATFKCDTATGLLTRTDTREIGKSLSWVMAVDLP